MITKIKTMLSVLFLLLNVSVSSAQSVSLSSEKITQMCKEYVRVRLEHAPEKVVLTLRNKMYDISLPEGAAEVKVKGEVEKDAWGRVPLRVEVFIDGELYKTLYPVFELDLKTHAFVSTRWVKRGEHISSDNVALVEILRSSLPPGAVQRSSHLEGKITKVSLPKGRVISFNHIEEPPLVQKKQAVTIVVKNEQLNVEARGITLMEGKKGAVIKVKNIDSGKIIYGEVKDKNIVEVKIP